MTKRLDLMGLLGACAAAAVLALGSPAAVAQSVELRVGLVTPPPHVWTQAANRLSERLAEATDGEVQIDVFPASQLGPESDMLQQMQAGVLDMGILSAGAVSARAPEFVAFFSPFAIEDVAATVDAAETEAAGEILETLRPMGIIGKGYVFAGMRHILMADQPVETLEDVQNKKIRITPFPGMQVWWQAAGAVPTPVQLGDVYQALSSGLLDGVDIDLDAAVGFSMQDVAEHLIITNHMAFPGVAMITEDAWNRLSPEQQETFDEVMDEVLDWAAEKQIATDAAHVETLRGEMNVIDLENAEEVFAPANEAFQNEFGDLPLVQKFQSELAE